ncbi:phage tail tape measure protein [Streptomyces litchfieldiae]|uniref:Phage tail tape measure protein n=1 Tax=Streptomyces litchfieldiae TaxID=3075543 RepID=A0ABU2MZ21_9ACTN|nr:phage tail tape measure protein [Streptomyces sp. DSM 44938]MDT0346756.1 phage tail tape measure protein [Streptomyces sp. DSM 44938]
MALNVGELVATLTVDDDGFASGLAGIRDQLSGFGAAALGAGIGAALVDGITQALEQEVVGDVLQAQLGATGPMAAVAGDAAGELYASAIVDSVQAGADVIRGIAQNGLLPPEATQAQIQQLGTRVADTATLMGEDVVAVSRAVGQMLRTGVADSASQALDVLVAGTQRGVNASEDLLDTFTEYSTQFRSMGLDAQTSMGLLQQGLQGGARDADIVADAIKEFSIEAVAGGDRVRGGFEALGLNADEMFAAFGRGGTSATTAFDTVLDSLRGIEDPTRRNAIAIQLFGTQAEDLGQALYSLDPSSAVNALGSVRGAADAAGTAMRDNAATQVTAFTRSLRQGFVEVVAAYVIPASIGLVGALRTVGGAFGTAAGFVSQNRGAFTAVATVITVLLLPTLVRLAVQAGVTTAATVTGWAAQSAAAATSAGAFLAANAIILAGWVRAGAMATATAARVVAAWVVMGATATARAAMMAAAWLISMGPIPLIIAAVVGLVALIVANWDTIKAATLAVWNWIWDKIKWAADLAVDLFLNFTLPGLIIQHWDTIRNATTRAWNWFWEKIKWAADKAIDVFLTFTLVGLIISHWGTIRRATTRAWNAIVDFIRGIPGTVADFFLNWTLVGRIIQHWEDIRSGVRDKAGQMLDYVRGLPGRITGFFDGLGDDLYGIGEDVVRGLWNGIRDMGGWLRDQITGWVDDVIPGPVRDVLGIFSPSRVMRDDIGRMIPAGLVEGIQRGAPLVDRAMRRLVEAPAVPFPALAAPAAPATTPADVERWQPRTRARAALHVEHWHAGTATPEQTAAALAWRMKARG